jgi:hypothetical protein
MTNWTQRARAILVDKTNPNLVSAVSAVPSGRILKNEEAPNQDSSYRKRADQYCWPHSDAMNGQEIDAMVARISRFRGKGMGVDAAELLADKLVQRDRGLDDRVVCLECVSLLGNTRGAQRCANWQKANLGQKASALPPEFVLALQRCLGFEGCAI